MFPILQTRKLKPVETSYGAALDLNLGPLHALPLCTRSSMSTYCVQGTMAEVAGETGEVDKVQLSECCEGAGCVHWNPRGCNVMRQGAHIKGGLCTKHSTKEPAWSNSHCWIYALERDSHIRFSAPLFQALRTRDEQQNRGG